MLAAVLASGCGEAADAPAPTFTVTDSAGIRIVENARAQYAPGAGWTLSAEPVVRMGVVHGDPAYEFSGIVGLTRLSDGRIVVLDEQTKELRFYAGDGTFLERVGRAGQGPGEFTAPGRLQRLAGDTLQIADFPTRIRYTSDGTLVEQIGIDWMPVKRHGDFYLECTGSPIFLDDLLIGCGESFPFRPEETERTGAARNAKLYVSVPRSFDRVDTLATIVGPLFAWNDEHGYLIRLNWPPITSFAFGGTPTHFAVSDGDAYDVRLLDLDGSTRMIVRRLDGMRALTESERAPPSVTPPPRSDRRFSRRPPNLPLVSDLTPLDSMSMLIGLFIDSENRVWGHVSDPSLGAGSWHDLFDADGRYLGPVRFPERFRIFEIGTDYVLGVRRDELDVEFVELYRLVRPG